MPCWLPWLNIVHPLVEWYQELWRYLNYVFYSFKTRCFQEGSLNYQFNLDPSLLCPHWSTSLPNSDHLRLLAELKSNLQRWKFFFISISRHYMKGKQMRVICFFVVFNGGVLLVLGFPFIIAVNGLFVAVQCLQCPSPLVPWKDHPTPNYPVPAHTFTRSSSRSSVSRYWRSVNYLFILCHRRHTQPKQTGAGLYD